jgi:hypothetical protein
MLGAVDDEAVELPEIEKVGILRSVENTLLEVAVQLTVTDRLMLAPLTVSVAVVPTLPSE